MRCSNSLSSTLTWSVATLGATLLAPAALAQDECTSAANVTAGVPASFDTDNATPSANPPTDALCPGTYLNWGTSKDVWFRFTAPQGGIVDFSTCSAGSYDTSMAIYRGTSCATATLIACNGDGEGEGGCQQYYSRVVGVSASAGDVFYIRIGGYTDAGGVSDSGPGALTVTFNAVSGACATATGECDEPHGGLGCNDPVCCSAVCAFNPLCCDVAWDAGCVQGAVDACGLFFYQCQPGGPVNNCATNATVVTASGTRTFNTTGATTDGPAHSSDTCNSGNDFFYNDVWWRIPVAANGTLAISTCGTTPYDNKLAVYDMGTNPASYDFNTLPDTLVACNDDGPDNCVLTDGTTPYASAMSVGVEAGRTYLVRMGSFTENETGSGSISFTVPTPCQLDSASQAEAEACGSAANNGCNAGGETENILIGTTVAGTFWADNNSRDTDFYRLSIASDTQVTVSVKSASFAQVFIMGGDIAVPDCDGVSIIATSSGACPATATACLKSGEYFVFVGTANADGSAAFNGNPCGNGVLNNYSVKVTGAPAECPIILGTVCNDPGPDSRQLSQAATTTGNFVQGCATGCGNLSGGNADTQFAVKIGAGNLLKEISCVNFGVAALRSVTPTGGTCGYGASDLLIPCEVGIYRDLDGGDPRNFVVTAGDGNDLELIQSFDVLVPSGVYMGTLEPEQPICVENETNLVFVLKTPNLFNGTVDGVPSGAGYRAGIGVAVPPAGGSFSTFNVFVRYTLCTGAGQGVFTPAGVAASGAITYQWPVIINGDAGSCGGGGNDCPADLDGNGTINGFDLSAVLAGWGTPAGDTNGDGTTNGIDITTILSAWNTNCP